MLPPADQETAATARRGNHERFYQQRYRRFTAGRSFLHETTNCLWQVKTRIMGTEDDFLVRDGVITKGLPVVRRSSSSTRP
jgi:hypothetical protein